jgi:hypothetical protein
MVTSERRHNDANLAGARFSPSGCDQIFEPRTLETRF